MTKTLIQMIELVADKEVKDGKGVLKQIEKIEARIEHLERERQYLIGLLKD